MSTASGDVQITMPMSVALRRFLCESIAHALLITSGYGSDDELRASKKALERAVMLTDGQELQRLANLFAAQQGKPSFDGTLGGNQWYLACVTVVLHSERDADGYPAYVNDDTPYLAVLSVQGRHHGIVNRTTASLLPYLFSNSHSAQRAALALAEVYDWQRDAAPPVHAMLRIDALCRQAGGFLCAYTNGQYVRYQAPEGIDEYIKEQVERGDV